MSLRLSQVRTLVGAQLRLDLRHPRTGDARSSRVVLTVVSYAFSSLILALGLAERGATLPELLFASHSFAMVLAAFGIAGSYDDVMGRPREHAQSRQLPVTEHTLYASRMVNILLFGAVVALSAAFPLALLAGWQWGLAAALTVGASLVAMIIGVMMAVLGAIWLLTLHAPVRMQRLALSATRAALVAALVLCFQVVAMQDTLIVAAAWWPATWVMEVLGGAGSAAAWLPLVVSGAVLLALFVLVFPDRYSAILERSAAMESTRHLGNRYAPAPNRLERLIARDPHMRAGYGLAAAAIKVDRMVRGRVWPALMLAAVFGAFAWYTGGLGDLFAYGVASVLFDPAVQMHLSVLTVLLFAAQAAIQGIKVSDHFEASWVFDVLPMRGRRALQIGAQQAVLVRVLFPVHVLLALLLSLSMPLGHAVLHAAFWFAGCALITRLQVLTHREPPLANSSDRFSAGERFVPLLMAIPAALVLLLLQSALFATHLSATLGVAGLLLLHSAIGQPPPRPITIPEPLPGRVAAVTE